MNILLITPHKGEVLPYYLKQKTAMIDSLRDEIPARNEKVQTTVMPLDKYDADNMTVREMKVLFSKFATEIENADIIHSFSELPLFFSEVFDKTTVFTLNLEKKYDELKKFLPEDGIPGTVVTSSFVNNHSLPYQELLPGFSIKKPSSEYDPESKNIIIFANDKEFAEDTATAVSHLIPDASFFVKFRKDIPDADKLNMEPFLPSMLKKRSFLSAIAQTGTEKDIDLIPLTVLSRGVPVFTVNNPVEKRFYPDMLHVNSLRELPEAMENLKKRFPDKNSLVDELHSFACRFFFFSKMTDDMIRLYNTTINNYMKKADRPWGQWEALKLAGNYKIKSFFVKPGEQISLQKHKHRAEIWIVAEGEGTILIDGESFEAGRGDVYMVKKEQVHRVSGKNSGIQIVEVQLGDYLGEDDIVRLQDSYGRS
ncbi:MAG: phosphomannose isomerase type II C-terminal cupin domain [bacterium]